jgi:DNA polymerase-3 subunit alpha
MNQRPFKDLDDMYQKVDTRVVNKTAFESLIKAGAMDSFGKNRKQLLVDYKTIKEFGQMRQSLFDAFKNEEGSGVFDEPEPTKEEIIEFEMDTIGLSLTYPSEWDFAKSGEVLEVEGIITESKEVKTRKSNKLMAFAKVKTDKNKIKLVVFPDTYRSNHDLFQKGFKLKLEGKKDKSNAMLVDKVKLIEGDFFKEAN